jgi:carbonic anhydrase/acetyltransferase-like protein (isoleucine patch superfamily)
MIYDLGGGRVETPPAGQYWVAPGAVLIGKVVLMPGASVWFGAILRGDNEPIVIGEDSNVQDAVVMHTDPGSPLILGRGVSIGHQAMLHGCEVGDGTLIGIGAVVLNGAKIGKQCLIGANALIKENAVIPDRSLVVGQPGRVIRTLDDEAAARLSRTAERYVANWKRYAAELKPRD